MHTSTCPFCGSARNDCRTASIHGANGRSIFSTNSFDRVMNWLTGIALIGVATIVSVLHVAW